ncbi:MAG TPA: sigma-70 family RNA polymerase sigma factor [Vicinamibacterales bacterium]|jgi:RNA polymerase sigma factor (TIGR02999 family)|nr:sigma-70 family RNA polymerase sigma factor [Vicinamibacterales bacterium]
MPGDRSSASSPDVTQLLVEWRGGRQDALDKLMPIVYRELHSLARRYLSRERSGHTLQSTALVHEVYLKLVDQRAVEWQNRAHFFGIAAQVMRRVLVDYARRRQRDKRRNEGTRVTLVDDLVASEVSEPSSLDAIALDTALTSLERLDPQQGRVVELRFFGGLTVEETAEVMNISTGTVKREWRIAKAWLYHHIQGAD